MLWIDWFYLDWHIISAWIFGILLSLYVIIKIKNHYYRWSISPPDFLQPYRIRQERNIQRDLKQTQIMVEGEGKKSDPVVIWVMGKCPRFLRNIALGLSLHAKKVCLNEVESHTLSLGQLELDDSEGFQIFYRNTANFGTKLDETHHKKTLILLAPKVLKDLKGQAGVQKYLISGKRIKQATRQELTRGGLTLINLRGGNHFRGWELALLGELIAIINKNRGVA